MNALLSLISSSTPLIPLLDHMNSAWMQTEDFILDMKIERSTVFPCLYLYIFSYHFNLSNQIKDVGYELLLYKRSCLVNRKEVIFPGYVLIYRGEIGANFASFTSSSVLFYYLMPLLLSSDIISVLKLILCQAKKHFVNHFTFLNWLTPTTSGMNHSTGVLVQPVCPDCLFF